MADRTSRDSVEIQGPAPLQSARPLSSAAAPPLKGGDTVENGAMLTLVLVALCVALLVIGFPIFVSIGILVSYGEMHGDTEEFLEITAQCTTPSATTMEARSPSKPLLSLQSSCWQPPTAKQRTI
eukprot:SAG31_NODE_9406_length_1282_cov_2.510566_1_plen_125_part_00